MKRIFVVAAIFLALAAPVSAQGTYTGTANVGVNRYYSFTPSVSGQFTATLSWDNAASNLILVLVCGTSNPLTFGSAADGLDRTARLESGLIGLNPCLIGVSTVDIVAAYRLNLQSSSDQLATPQTATLRGVVVTGDGPVDARLAEQANSAIAALKALVR